MGLFFDQCKDILPDQVSKNEWISEQPCSRKHTFPEIQDAPRRCAPATREYCSIHSGLISSAHLACKMLYSYHEKNP
ncbi:MAG: hypothetical protein C4576_22510 [Desulfobacteraceae bacterium]|nr:MAG: hypothetical protein C4576_22510 [Desulfobacteraceae bacterium]